MGPSRWLWPVGAVLLVATPMLGQAFGRTMKPGRRMLMRLMSSMGEAETILRCPTCSTPSWTPRMTR